MQHGLTGDFGCCGLGVSGWADDGEAGLTEQQQHALAGDAGGPARAGMGSVAIQHQPAGNAS